MITNFHNPDILSCLSNLSSDEVFTPPDVANEMLDALPQEIWQDKSKRFLDPFCKSGVFLREITKRLLKGLKEKIPDIEERLEHILKNQIFGLSISPLTSLISRRTLYCSKYANGKYSVVKFSDEEGNIKYLTSKHFWSESDRCKFCGASKKLYDRNKDLETYAYSFIHPNNLKEVFDMKFDVVIGNPPYQMEDGGSSRSATPIYDKFIECAKKLDPQYLIMIIPSRWFAGGKGLSDFRKEMLNDTKIKKLVDFENASTVFPGVDIAGGVCYFLRDKHHDGECEVINLIDNSRYSSMRKLNEFSIFIRRPEALSLVKKIMEWQKDKNLLDLSKKVSSRKPFGIPGNYPAQEEGIPCYFTKKIGKKFAKKKDLIFPLDIKSRQSIIDKWKVLIPYVPIAGQTDFSKPIRFYHPENCFISEPGVCSTETWLIASYFDTEEEALNFRSYLFTKTVRYLLLQTVISQHVTRENFQFIPALQTYDRHYTDEFLIEEWKISEQEWKTINNKILDAKL